MPRRIAAISVLIVLALFGCQDSEEGSPTSIILGDSAKMSLRLVVPTNLNIDSGEITIIKGDLEYSQSVDLQDGSASVVFIEIQPGIWQIHVALYDSDEFMLYEGSGEAEVYGGETASAHIVLTELSGDLEITIEMPPEGEDGLVAYYPFNGNANDESGNSHHGVPVGAVLTEDRFGHPDRAYEIAGNTGFNGSGIYVDIPNTIHQQTSATISVWAKIYNNCSGHGGAVISFGRDNSGLYPGWVAIVCGEAYHEELAFLITRTGEDDEQRLMTGIETSDLLGEYHHFAMTYDGVAGQLNGYLDSELVGTMQVGPGELSATGENAGVGVHWYWDDPIIATRLNGIFDDVRVYDRALTGGEISDLYGAGEPPVGPEMVLVPGGTYEMGRHVGSGHSNELPVHSVQLNPFMMGVHEVTNSQYCDFLNHLSASGSIYVLDGVVYNVSGGEEYCDTAASSS